MERKVSSLFFLTVFSTGVSVLFRKGLECGITSKHKTIDAWKLMIYLNLSNITNSLVNIYSPNKEKIEYNFDRYEEIYPKQLF